ncbi:MAG: NUDIX hydrolase [Dehalococcoidia bacterium]|nr:NUDIX hydrolase [Dehalococcoidia bacterium]
MARVPQVREAVSAGGVVYRLRDGRAEIVLVARPVSNLWALPKGTPEAGESLEQTALREVSEETGLIVDIVEPISEIAYSFHVTDGRVRVDKVVHHFLMAVTGGDVQLHDHEYDLVGWYGVAEALRLMTYDNERTVVERAGVRLDQLIAEGHVA